MNLNIKDEFEVEFLQFYLTYVYYISTYMIFVMFFYKFCNMLG